MLSTTRRPSIIDSEKTLLSFVDSSNTHVYQVYLYIILNTGLGSCRSLSLWQWMDCERMESPAPTDRMPKNSRMNNYFLIGGWQRKSGITNFPKFCIELHSSLLTAGGWRPGHRQKVCGQKMQRAAGTSPAQPSQPSPAQPSPAQPRRHNTWPTNCAPTLHQADTLGSSAPQICFLE